MTALALAAAKAASDASGGPTVAIGGAVMVVIGLFGLWRGDTTSTRVVGAIGAAIGAAVVYHWYRLTHPVHAASKATAVLEASQVTHTNTDAWAVLIGTVLLAGLWPVTGWLMRRRHRS